MTRPRTSFSPVLLLLLLGSACQGEAPAPASSMPASNAGSGTGGSSGAEPTPAPATNSQQAAAPNQPVAAPAGPEPPKAATTASAMPDLAKGLEQGSCGNGPGNEGADSYFIGEYTISGNQVMGTERWLLHANAKLMASKLWKAGSDCEVRWMMRGVTTSPQHCGDCDLGLDVSATADVTGSTCPEDMVKREKSFQVRYDVRRSPDGVAWFYFANSGKVLGQGYHQGDRVSFLTQHQCKWF